MVLDPFVGAGTTLLACQDAGVESLGCDLSPLAAFVSRVKTSPPSPKALRKAWTAVSPQIKSRRRVLSDVSYDGLVLRAFPGDLLPTLHGVRQAILETSLETPARNVLLLALLAILPKFSRLVRKGGWLEERQESMPAQVVRTEFKKRIDLMMWDLDQRPPSRTPVTVQLADVRDLPLETASVSGVITSPPYPNRHDYTRVFGVELQFAFLSWEELRRLRYQSFYSHPEAHPDGHRKAGNYAEPPRLTRTITRIGRLITDNRAKTRIPQMLHGYFQDMYLALTEIERVLQPGSSAALVVGNVTYCGVPVEVDRCTIEVGEQAGLLPETAYTARYRGNSAQQMRDHGRQPQRESVVIFRKP